MSTPPERPPPRPATLEYQTPESARAAAEGRRGVKRPVIWVVGTFILLSLIAYVFLPAFNGPLDRRGMTPRSRCASNLRNIAAGMIEYSNKNNGQYPDRIETLFVASGMTSEILVCPDSHDVRATGTVQEQSAALTAGGHCSYIYMGKGLTSADTPAEAVLAYEPMGNHFNQGMNVLFGDYHVEFIDAKTAQAMLKSIVPGKPLIWPTANATAPTTQGK